MKIHPIILPRRAFRNKKVCSKGSIAFQVHVLDSTGIVIGLSAIAYEIDWGDGLWDSDLMHTYEKAGIYQIRIYGVEINELNISHCWVREIDVSECPWLEYLNVSYNALKKLDVSRCPYLSFLDCSVCMIQELILGDYLPWLIYLNCSRNLLKTLEFPRECNLYGVIAHHNELVKLNMRVCASIRCVDIAYNAMQFPDLRDTLESVPVVSGDEPAYIMYEMNPSSFEVDEQEIKARGWRLQAD